ncbi:ubiquitin domain-containing protein UBFD1-like [Sipha flava]|uniref:Ubiquitin domain-containing protein UBFD1 n=1 Tax=Sipha flava TaxID=143950 RepID=A0A2S2R6C4_9HEMI|nr:ubiquitin domain-containing protein UBFD1-like [Sipha flava]XP_025422056.1 ubiquitin domain-containing protein UBFD1-like [Sipha flava]
METPEEINGLKETVVATKVAKDETTVTEDETIVAKHDETTVVDSDMKKEASDAIDESPPVEFTIIHNKDKYTVSMPLLSTIGQLKDKLVDMIGVPSKMQKIMIKGLAKDDQTLESLNVNSSSKIMVVGAKLQDIVAVSVANVDEDSNAAKSSSTVKEPLCKKKLHMKVLERGIPDDAMVGILNIKDPLPPYPLSGMLNKHGGKVRLTFKLELDQLWIGTKERTQKIAMNTIRHVVSEPIEGHAEYHIVGFQLGTTEASRYWVYWVPAQYIDSIKEAIFGG